MQKKLIALAVAGLVSAPVFAQSNVTIYGIADAYVGIGDHGDVDLNGVQSGGLSGSRLGFRGTEDLGNGLKAVFTLEQGYNIDTGTESAPDTAFQRQAFVGLSGGFGTVALGRQYAPGYYIVNDPLASSGVSAHVQMVTDAGVSIAPNSAARWDNAITYTGTFSGLTARAIYAMGASEANTDRAADVEDDDRYALGLAYANGPLSLEAYYHVIQTAAARADDQTEWLIGAGYKLGFATLMATYQEAEDIVNKVGGYENMEAWQIGGVIPVGAAGNVHVAYGQMEYDTVRGGEVDTWGVAYTHGLSKRTTAYVGYNNVGNDANTNAGIAADDAKFGVLGNGDDSNLFVVGVRHAF